MPPDAAERWLEGPEPEPVEPPPPVEPAPPSATPAGGAARRTCGGKSPPTRRSAGSSRSRSSRPAAEEQPEPQIYGVGPLSAGYEAEPRRRASRPQIREDWEREQRFDPAPGCIPVQGPYLNEADRPCAFPDGSQIPTGQIGTQPEEARPCVPLQGPYLSEDDRPCAVPGRP